MDSVRALSIAGGKWVMQRFKKILAYVHLEGEDHCALGRTAQPARNNNAALRVVTVQEELPKWARILLPPKIGGWEQIVEAPE